MKVKKIVLAIILVLLSISITGCFNQTLDKKNPGYKTLNTQERTSVVATEVLSGAEIVLSGTVDEKKITVPADLLKIIKYNYGNTVVSVAGDIKNDSKIVDISCNSEILSVKTLSEVNSERTTKKASETLLGDFDLSGTVDLKDFQAFAQSYGTFKAQHDIAPATRGTGDWINIYCYATPDGKVELSDFIVFAKNYGRSSPVSSVLTSITITRPPTKTGYFVGESILSLDGLIVTGTYSNGTTKTETVTTGLTSGFSTTTAGNKTITVTIEGKSATFTIIVSGFMTIDGFIPVEGGTFNMGENTTEYNASPVHSVTLSDFYIGKYEVTQKDWQDVMGSNPSANQGENFPVTNVGWIDCIEFCNKKSEKDGLEKCYTITQKDISGTNIVYDFSKNGYRLPTEAEWEYAAKGGKNKDNYKYSGSDNLDEVSWNSTNSGNTIHVVGTKKANSLGIYDMSGNVTEFCFDWYASYSEASAINPTGANTGNLRVVRGGYYAVNAEETNQSLTLRVSKRNVSYGYGYSQFGFRLARNIPNGVFLTSLAVTRQPTKTSYSVGETILDLAGLVVTGTYSDGTTKTETVTIGTISGFSTTTAGTKTITITIAGKSTTFSIIVNNTTTTLMSIAVTTQPTKLNYNVGETNLELAGLIVTGTYSDGTKKAETVTLDATSGFSTSTVGTKTITVTIGGKSTTFAINVSALPGTVVFVNGNTTGTEDGTEAHPFKTIQGAVTFASSNTTIKVAQGTYNENVVIPGNKAIQLLGGYQNGNFNNRNIPANITKIQGNSSSAVVSMAFNSGYGVRLSSVIDGFTVSGGQRGIYITSDGNGGKIDFAISNNIVENNGSTGNNDNGYGSGIMTNGIVPTISNNTIRNNRGGKGSGLSVLQRDINEPLLIQNNTIENNISHLDHGGGVYLSVIRGLVTKNIIRNNRVGETAKYGWGGGMIVDGGAAVDFSDSVYLELSYNVYTGNYSPSIGGGLFIDEGANVRMNHELIYKNKTDAAQKGGAGLYVDGTRGTVNAKTILTNCTIADNLGAAESVGNAIYIEGGSEVEAYNSIFWGNLSGTVINPDFYVNANSSLKVIYSIYQNGKTGEGTAYSATNNLLLDPLFSDTANNDYHLKSVSGRWNPITSQWVNDPVSSPGIDSGDPTSSYSNEPAPNGSRVNLGAYGNTLESSKSKSNGVVYNVGPNRTYKTPQAVVDLLNPGDIVLVDGDATYPGDLTFRRSGSKSNVITITGVNINGKRPIISGGVNTVHFRYANYYVFENFEITGGTGRGVFHQGDQITIRDSVIHDCPAHGLAGADDGSGSLTLEYTEIYRCGNIDTKHPVYMATDLVNFPNSVFKMQFCYLHDQLGGNNIKSRSERNEIYYNWVEGGYYKELELIGADTGSGPPRPMNSDVVGNVFVKTKNSQQSPMVRMGHDWTGDVNAQVGTHGRYRFLNNTFIISRESTDIWHAVATIFHPFAYLESIEMSNNVFFHTLGQPIQIINEDSAQWVNGRIIAGQNNWVPTGVSANWSQNIPPEWTGTIKGTDPGFANVTNFDLRLTATSPLRNAGTNTPFAATGHPFPSPLNKPCYLPSRSAQKSGQAVTRSVDSVLDIGAYE